MRRAAPLALGFLLWAGVASAQTPAQVSQLAKARQSFNQGLYDQAIAAAKEASAVPALAPAANLVLGRAYVERYQAAADSLDLQQAHAVFAAIDAERLSSFDRRDLTIGLGLTVFFEGRPGAAAEMLEVALATPVDAANATPRARQKLFDWWATAVDRAAQLAPDAGRHKFYERIMHQSELELARDSTSTAAGYWLAAGARGAAELDRAWHAAIAAWIRAKGPSLHKDARLNPNIDPRVDLDILVVAAIIPERARALDPRATQALIAAMRAEWEQIKSSW